MLSELLHRLNDSLHLAKNKEESRQSCVQCGSTAVPPKEALHLKVQGEYFYFCSKACNRKFRQALREIRSLVKISREAASRFEGTEKSIEVEVLAIASRSPTELIEASRT